MAVLVLDPSEERRLKRERKRNGADRYDEVWEGMYVMAPLANNQHQWLALEIATAIRQGVRFPEDGIVFPGCNVSDRREKWEKNYRCPDVAVFLAGNPAEDRETHWYGGPDFAVEIVSPGDRSRDKLEFYFGVGVRELLVVDRKPWRLELYRNDGEALSREGACTASKVKVLNSQVIPFRFSLASGQPRPTLIITRRTDGHTTRI
ncbi:MAG TPA: Uma2 family endonuclease [Gemmataceae bacterium]|nr:Uma2 family endonuclease [Gemmataceae bacterium]